MPRISIEDVPPLTAEERTRLLATSEADIRRHAAEDGDADLDENPPQCIRVIRACPDARRLRRQMNMTQEEFARCFGLNLWTLRDWEQHKSEPEGPARTLLCVIEREPDAVRRALTAG